MSQAQPGEVQTRVVDGLGLAKTIRKELSEEIGALVAKGHRPPCLAVVLVGDDPASRSYIKGKQRACANIGAGMFNYRMLLLTGDAKYADWRRFKLARQPDCPDCSTSRRTR